MSFVLTPNHDSSRSGTVHGLLLITLLSVDQTVNRPDKENKLKQTSSCARRPHHILWKTTLPADDKKENWLKSYLFPGMSARKAFEPQEENWKLLPMPLAQSHRGCLRECVILRPEPSMRLAASRSHGSRPRCRGVKVTRSLTFFSKHRSKKVIFTWHAWNTNRLKSNLPNTMKITPFTENVCRIDYSKFQCCIFITF